MKKVLTALVLVSLIGAASAEAAMCVRCTTKNHAQNSGRARRASRHSRCLIYRGWTGRVCCTPGCKTHSHNCGDSSCAARNVNKPCTIVKNNKVLTQCEGCGNFHEDSTKHA